MKKRKRFAALVMIGLFTIATVFAGSVSAQEGHVVLRAEAGWSGKVREGSLFPLRVTVSNPGDRDVSGDVVVRVAAGDGLGESGDVAYVRRLDLPAGGGKAVWFALPGQSYTDRNHAVEFYAGGYPQGKPAASEPAVKAQLLPANTAVVGVMARDPDAMAFLSLLNAKGYDVDVVRLDAATDRDFPWEPELLDMLDAVVLSAVPTDTLPAGAAEQLERWVAGGGKLFLAGGAAYPKTAAALEALSPVAYRGTTRLESLDSLAAAVGEPNPPSGPLTVSVAELRNGAEPWIVQSGVPVAVRRPRGFGEVWYLAYDLSEKPLASWPGHAELWAAMLGDSLKAEGRFAKAADLVIPQSVYELENELNFFPGQKALPLGVLSLLFLVYATAVSWGVYFLLKRRDRREWAWWAVPAVAVLSSAAMFAVGAAERRTAIAQTLEVTMLSGDGYAVRMVGVSAVVPSGGDYTLEWPEVRFATVFVGFGNAGKLAGKPRATIERVGNGARVMFFDAPFWSLGKAFAPSERLSGVGALGYDVRYDGSVLEGVLRNDTDSKLWDVHVVSGANWVRVGDLEAGASATFRLPASRWGGRIPHDVLWQIPLASSSPGASPSATDPVPAGASSEHRRSLLTTFVNATELSGARLNAVYAFGWRERMRSDLKLNGKPVRANTTELVVQELRYPFVRDGRIVVPKGVIAPKVISPAKAAYLPDVPGYRVDEGALVLEFALPRRADAEYRNLRLVFGDEQSIQWSVWNEADRRWEPVAGQSAEWAADRPARYLIGGSLLRVRAAGPQGATIRAPDVTAEGVIAR